MSKESWKSYSSGIPVGKVIWML